jgi:hypothetical protein
VLSLRSRSDAADHAPQLGARAPPLFCVLGLGARPGALGVAFPGKGVVDAFESREPGEQHPRFVLGEHALLGQRAERDGVAARERVEGLAGVEPPLGLGQVEREPVVVGLGHAEATAAHVGGELVGGPAGHAALLSGRPWRLGWAR